MIWNTIAKTLNIMEGGEKRENVTGVVLNDDLEFWMTRFPAPLKNIPIIHLAIPGTFKYHSAYAVILLPVEFDLHQRYFQYCSIHAHL